MPFIDTGIGVTKDDDGVVNGSIRITASLPGRTEHIDRDGLISHFVGDDDEYDTNLQVVELNSIAASLPVMRYKKHLGFYADAERELHAVAVYEVDSNEVFNRYGADGALQLAEHTDAVSEASVGGDGAAADGAVDNAADSAADSAASDGEAAA